MVAMAVVWAVALLQVDVSALLPMVLQVFQDATGSKWGPLMVLFAGWLVQLLSEDSKFPISMPKGWSTDVWKPVVVVLATQLAAGVEAVVDGHTPVLVVVLTGLKTAMWTMGLWALVIKAAYGGKAPKWMNYLALIFPSPSDPSILQKTPPSSSKG